MSGGNGRYWRKRILDVKRIIREARPTDMTEIMKVMDAARKIMRQSGNAHGIFSSIMDYCFSKDLNIRIDTHRDNQLIMA